MQVSILVPFKSFGDPDRDANWAWIRNRFEALHSDWEICVGESEQPFNRGQAINHAASKAKGDIFYVSDADCFVYPEQAKECVKLASEAPGCVIAATRWIALEQAFSREVRTGHPDIRFTSDPPAWCDVNGTVSGCLAISREGFENVKGFPNEFAGWGNEDNAFWYKVSTLVAPGRRLDGEMFHLWHPSARNPDSVEYQLNEARCNEYGAADGDPEKMRELIA